jgi:hypothetical protein
VENGQGVFLIFLEDVVNAIDWFAHSFAPIVCRVGSTPTS